MELKRTQRDVTYAYGILGKSSCLTQVFFIPKNTGTLQMVITNYHYLRKIHLLLKSTNLIVTTRMVTYFLHAAEYFLRSLEVFS
jgi:hypothetical protein